MPSSGTAHPWRELRRQFPNRPRVSGIKMVPRDEPPRSRSPGIDGAMPSSERRIPGGNCAVNSLTVPALAASKWFLGTDRLARARPASTARCPPAERRIPGGNCAVNSLTVPALAASKWSRDGPPRSRSPGIDGAMPSSGTAHPWREFAPSIPKSSPCHSQAIAARSLRQLLAAAQPRSTLAARTVLASHLRSPEKIRKNHQTLLAAPPPLA